jgi:hypothetical protein
MHPISGRASQDELRVKVLDLMDSDGEGYTKYMEENFKEDIEKIKRMDA